MAEFSRKGENWTAQREGRRTAMTSIQLTTKSGHSLAMCLPDENAGCK